MFFNRYDDCDALDGTLDFSEHLLALILVNKGYTADPIVLSGLGTLDTAETIRTSFQVSIFDEADVTYFNVSVFLDPPVACTNEGNTLLYQCFHQSSTRD